MAEDINENKNAFADGLNVRTVNLSGARDAVKIAWLTKRVPVLCSESGIGKTDVVHQLGEEMGAQVIKFSCANADPTDLLGPLMPRKDGTYTWLRNPDIPLKHTPTLAQELVEERAWYVLEEYGEVMDGAYQEQTWSARYQDLRARIKQRRKSNDEHAELLDQLEEAMLSARRGERRADRATILFFDEINRARGEEMLNALFPVWNERRLGNYELGDNVYIVCAMNPHGEGYNVVQLGKDPAERRRFVWVAVERDFSGWLRYARAKKWHPSVIRFVSQGDELAYDTGALAQGHVFATYATWEQISQILYELEDRGETALAAGLLTVLSGMIGADRAVSFLQAYRDENGEILDVTEIVENFSPNSPAYAAIAKLKEGGHFQRLAQVAPVVGEMFIEAIVEAADAEGVFDVEKNAAHAEIKAFVASNAFKTITDRAMLFLSLLDESQSAAFTDACNAALFLARSRSQNGAVMRKFTLSVQRAFARNATYRDAVQSLTALANRVDTEMMT